MNAPTQTLSRRGFFRGHFSPKSEHNWHPVQNLPTESGDVFWSGWSDQEGVFVAGDNGVILHFDGEAWKQTATDAPVPVHAIWGNSRRHLWAVGWMGAIFKFETDHWTRQSGCIVDEDGKYARSLENTPLFDIDGSDDDRIWAVGDQGRILFFDGENWVEEDSGTRVHLRSVTAMEDGRVMAAGGDGTVLMRSLEGQWEKLDCPVHSNFVAALELEEGRVLLAGGRYFISAHGFRGDLIMWDGEGFHKLFEGAEFSRFRDLALYKGGVITVGDSGEIHTIRDGKITRSQSGTTHDLLALLNLPDGEALAVGDFGTALAGHAEALENFAPYVAPSEVDAEWSPCESGTDRQLWGTWYDDEADRFYACGEEGVVLVHDRGKWESLPACGALGIHALNRSSDGGLLAAGQLGEIHHFDGQKWEKQFDLFMDITLLSLYSDGAGGMIATGDEGLALKWEGDDWTRMSTGTKSALYGMWGNDADHILAVGDFGLILRWNGESWDEFSAGTEQFLFDVWGRALDDIHVVGLSGTIGHFNGERWRITPARARQDLLAVTGDETHIVAVGAAGIATCFDGKRWQAKPTGVNVGLRDVSADRKGRFMAVGDQGTIITYQSDIAKPV